MTASMYPRFIIPINAKVVTFVKRGGCKNWEDINPWRRNMRKNGKETVLVVLLLVLIVGGIFAEGAQEENVRRIVAESLQSYAKYVSRGDAERWLALHEDGAYKMPQDAPMFTIASVKDTQQQKYDARDAVYAVDMNIEPMEIDVAGDIAYAAGTFTVDLKPRADAPPRFVEGKFLTLYRRQKDGTWKIHLDSYSNNTPPAK
jgi:ketosteroid isomerase-like protein